MRILPLKTLLLSAFSIFTFQCAIAQLYINGDLLKVEPNALLHVNGNIITVKNGTTAPKLRNHGIIGVKGNVDLNTDTDYKGQGKIQFLGSSQQTLSPNIPLKKIEIQNGNNVALTGNLNLQGEITLTNGHLELGNYDLTLDDSVTISGGSSSSYIRINGNGKLKATVGKDPMTLPIGRNPYLPVIIENGGDKEYTVGISDKVYANPETNSTEQTSSVVTETWSVQSSGAQNGVSVTLQWNASDETQPSFNRSSAFFSYWENGVSSVWNNGTSSSAAGSDPYTLTRTIDFTTNLFYFGIGSSGSALPVDLTYINAEWLVSASLSARLTWQTASETNNSHFEVERSFDGVNFERIGSVEGNGTTLLSKNYEFIDELAGKGPQLAAQVYYRLKQVDYDGKYEYSDTRTLNQKPEGNSLISLYPNPASTSVGIKTSVPVFTIEVYNLQGQLVKQVHNSPNIRVGDLPKGQYMFRVQNKESTTQHKVLIH